jgi:hypothetical protein
MNATHIDVGVSDRALKRPASPAAPPELRGAIGAIGSGRRKFWLMTADSAALVLGVVGAFAAQAIIRPVPDFVIEGHLILALTTFPGFAVGAGLNHLYQSRYNERHLQEAHNVINAVAVGIAMLVLVAFLAQFKELSRLWVALLAASMTLTLPSSD